MAEEKKKKKIPKPRTKGATHNHNQGDKRGPFKVKGVTKDITYYNLHCTVCGKFMKRLIPDQ